MNRVTNEDSVDPELFDDDELELVAVASGTHRPIGAQISVRFDSESTRLLQRAAALEGLTQAEFVRRAAMHAARKSVAHAS